MKHSLFFLSIILLMSPLQYGHAYINEQIDDTEYNNQVKQFVIPNKNDISVSGPIDTLLVDGAYYKDLLNARIHSSFEDEHTIKSTLFYVPLSLLDDVTEKNAFNSMYNQLNNMWQQPLQEEYAQALAVMRSSNDQLIKDTIIEEMQQETLERSLVFFDLLEKIYQLSDSDFVNELLDLASGVQMQKNIYKDKIMGGIFDSVDEQSKETIFKTILDTISALRSLETAPCVTTATFVCTIVDTIKAMNLQPELLIHQAKGEMEKLSGSFACMFTKDNVKAVETVSITILLKIVCGLLAKNLGTTFEQYHAKRIKEVDYLILEKIAEVRPTEDELKVGQGSVRVDEKTVCTLELSENGFTGEPILLVECTTTI